MTFAPPQGGRGERNASPKGNPVLKGRLIQPILRGKNNTSRTWITRMTIRVEVGEERLEDSLA
jgi:hypothetical protein